MLIGQRVLPAHQGVVDILLEMEHMVADRQVVQQAERSQDDAVAHRECQSHFFA